MSKHTPGPWTTPGTDGGDRVVFAQVNGRHRTIAHVYAPYIDHDESGEERDANAALIAAAPELLDALHHALAALDDAQKLHPHWIYADAQNAARNAIAKAEGRTE